MENPITSVLMLAHNHQEFISEAIQSIVTQRCEFEFELLIGEDASTDGTAVICKDYQRRYPTMIRVISHVTNTGMHNNFKSLWENAKGKYIGFCEGDDYWKDPEKLEKQILFFKENPDCTLCGTLTEKIELNDAGRWETKGVVSPDVVQQKYRFHELISNYNFHFSSVLVRKNMINFPDWFATVYCVDRPLYLLAAENGKAGLIPEVASVYRIHKGGNWSSNSMQKKSEQSIDLFLKMRCYFDAGHKKQFGHTLGRILWSYMAEELEYERLKSARGIFWKSVKYSSKFDFSRSPGLFLKVMLRLYFPRAYNALRNLKP